MSSAHAAAAPLIVRHERLDDFAQNRYAGMHAGVPLLMALAILGIAGIGVAVTLAPAAIKPLIIALTALMIGASGLTFFSIFASGEVIEAAFDDDKKSVQLLYRGPTAHSIWKIPMSRISGARMLMRYTPTGTKELQPTLDLVNGQSIILPTGTTWDDIEQIRQMLPTVTEDTAAAAWNRKEASKPAAIRNRKPAPRR